MKKSIFISVFNMEIGGIERSLINMLESIDYSAYEVDLFICHHTGDLLGQIPASVNVLPEIARYAVFRKPLSQVFREGHYVAVAIRLMSKLAAGLKAKFRKMTEGSGYIQMQLDLKLSAMLPLLLPAFKKTYDLAISYAWPHDIVTKRVSARKKIAWIHTDYSQLEIDHDIDRSMWESYEHIAAVSEDCAKSFVSQYPALLNRVRVIENIASPSSIRMMADQFEPAELVHERAFKIVSVGRLSYVKGFDLAVRALRKLHDQGLTDVKWYVVGYGGYEEELLRIVKDHALTESFVLLGKQLNPYPYIKACDLYVQPSRYEGKAVTVTEAQILAKPVLITNYPTAPSQVRDQLDGMICESTADGIAEGIKSLYRDEQLRARFAMNNRHRDFANTAELEKLYALVNESSFAPGKSSKGVMWA